MDLIPPELIIARHFADEQAVLEKLQVSYERAAQRVEEFVEEHTGDGGALVGLEGARGISKGSVQLRVMEYREIILKEYPKGTPEHEQAQAIKKTSFGECEWPQGMWDAGGLFEELTFFMSICS